MTNLVGILCGDKIWKQVFSSALLLIIISTFFLSVFSTVLAQGGPAGGVPGVDRPFRPGEVPPVFGPGSSFPSGVGGTGNGNPNPNPNVSDPTVFGPGPTTDPGVAAAQAEAQAAAYAASEGLGSTPDGVLGLIYSYVLTGVGWVVGIAGSAFDYSIENFIIGFGQLYRTGTGQTIDMLWGTVRDIFNLTFIFGLVYIGFKMILDSSDSSARKMLVSLIGAALLVNFSLFITKFVIDFSNIAATQIYNAFDTTGPQLSITNGFMTLMGINSILGYKYTAGGSFAFVLGVLIIFCILAYVFLAGAVLIIIRFVVLNIYMVFSPFMFLGWVFPALASYSRDYWSGFMRQAFFAPAFIFMLYLSYVVARTFPTQRNLGLMFNPNATTVTDIASMIPYFAMVMVFLCASMIVAKKMGAHGSTMAINVGNKIRGSVQSSIGRNTVGRGAEWLGKKNDALEGSRTGRNFKRALSVASLGALDERGRRNIIKSGKEAKFGGSYSRSDDKKFATELATTQAAGAFGKSIKKGLSDTSIASQIEFEQAISHASSPQLIEQLGKHESSSPEYKRIVQAMSHSQVTGLLNSKDDELSPGKRAALAKVRGVAIKEKIEDGGPLEKGMAKASADDLVALGYDELSTNAQFIPGTKMDDLKGKLTSTEFKELAKERKTQLETSFASYASRSSVFNQAGSPDRKKDSEIARLPDTILTDVGAVPFMNVRVLDIILRENLLTSSQRATLKGHINTLAAGNNSPAAASMQDWIRNTPAGKGF